LRSSQRYFPAVDPGRQIRQAVGIDVARHESVELGILQRTLRIRQIQRRHGARQITVVRPAPVARLNHTLDEGTEGPLAVDERSRAHQTVIHPEFLGKVMEHQHAPAEALRPHFEGRTKGGKRVPSRRPCTLRLIGGMRENPALAVRRLFPVVAFPVIEHQAEHPVRLATIRRF
jgi:hypothetical protein